MSRTGKDLPFHLLEARYPYWHYKYWFGPPSKRERHVEWYGPDRARVRDSLKSVAKEFRATGETDVHVSTYHHRHHPIKRYWW